MWQERVISMIDYYVSFSKMLTLSVHIQASHIRRCTGQLCFDKYIILNSRISMSYLRSQKSNSFSEIHPTLLSIVTVFIMYGI